MAYGSLSEFVRVLEEAGELKKVDVFTDPVLEISEITDRISKSGNGGKALLFTNTGTDFPVLMNSMGSLRRICLALGVDHLDDIGKRIDEMMGRFTGAGHGIMQKLALLPELGRLASLFPSRIPGKAACQEVVLRDHGLDIFPVLQTWPADGGRFITLPIVHTVDPESGERNAGMYRMQVFDQKTTGMHWHRHKTGANHYSAYKKSGKVMPIAVALGGDPVYTYAATAPLPENVDEYLFAGFLRKKAVPLVRCITQDIEVPADADIILEGYVDPGEDLRREGPFGDHTGFYSLEDDYPIFHITCITHRKKAIYPATIVGIPPQEDAWIARATERIFMFPIRKTVVPELTDMEIPPFGVAHNLTIAGITKSYPGQAKKVMNAMWGAGQMMFNKLLIITDEQADVHDMQAIAEKLLRIDPGSDIVFSSGPLDVLDHSADFTGYGSKAGIDLTNKLKEELLIRTDVQNIDAIRKTYGEGRELSFLKSVGMPRDAERGGYCLMNIIKEENYSFSGLCRELATSVKYSEYDFFILADENVDSGQPEMFFWYVLNNTEPRRDVLRLKDIAGRVRVFIDGTVKTYKHDGFSRPWPNPVVMDKKMMGKVDSRWPEYHLGPFLESPSRIYGKLSRGTGAVALENKRD